MRTLVSPILLTTALALSGCGTKEDTADAAPCTGTTAEAGPNQRVPLSSTVALNGAGSKLCPNILGLYTWSFLSVPTDSSVTDSDLSENGTETALSSTFIPDVIGTYVVGLVVSSGEVRSEQDIVIIEVVTGDQAPLADCGPDLTVMVGEAATLNASSSYDPEGSTLRYEWSITSTPSGSSLGPTSLYNDTGPTPSIIPDVAGTFIVSLTVGDAAQWSAPAYCSVTAMSENQMPVADAGEGAILPPCTDPTIQLNGFGSYDPEGAEITYLWSLASNPIGSATSNASLNDPTLPNPTFEWDIPGTYTFDLQVNDGELGSPPDVVTYVIQSRDGNGSPIANAGDDQTISETGSCTGTVYTAITCTDCPATTLELDGTSSYDPDGDEFEYFWSEPSGDITLATPYSPTTLATTPAQPATFDVTTTNQWFVDLSVADCVSTHTDQMVITYNCTGKR